MILDSLQFAAGTTLLAATVVNGTQLLSRLGVWSIHNTHDWLLDVVCSVRLGVLVALACLGIALMRSAS